MIRRFSFAAVVVASAVLLGVAGCSNSGGNQNQGASPGGQEPKVTVVKKDEDHGHKPGGHGGIIVPLGRDSYHVEAVFQKGGKVRIYTLGKDEARVLDVELQDLDAFARADGETEAVAIQFQPAPQPGDAAGKTSLFIAQLPKELVGKKLEVTVPSIKIGDERFRFAFPTAGSHDAEMSASVQGDAAKELYLTPGGMYTAADIKANGTLPAAQKYKGIPSAHDMKPKSGDKICPITSTKANPQFTWIVGGKTYEFCCPPCIDEFVSEARTNPDSIKAPEEYVKKK